MSILKDFFLFTESDNKNVSGECKICGKNYSDSSGSTGNFHKHLKRKHNKQYEESKSKGTAPSESETDNFSENLTINIIKINKLILEELIIRCNVPPSIIEHTAFRKFLKMLAPKWKPASSRYFTKTLLPSLTTDIQNKIKDLLSTIEHISITVDVWSDRRGKSFIGVTGHFLDSNCIPNALLLDFQRLKGPHTGENIHHITVEILDRFKIKDKVYRIITDNASSMIKAYKFGLIVVNADEVIQNEYNELDSSDVTELNDDDNFNILNEWILVDWCEHNHSLIDQNDDNGKRLSCFAHSLQLAIRDGLKNIPYLSKSLSKCIMLARRSHRSTTIADLLDDIGKTINRSNVTRWCSEYLLIKSIIQLGKNVIDEVTDIIADDNLRFNNNDIIVLQEAISILEPFADITLRIQSDSVVTASLVVPSIVHIIDHLKTMKQHVSFMSNLCKQLEDSINKRFSGIVKRLAQQSVSTEDPFSDPIYFVCTVLDPGFRFYWIDLMNYKPTIESCIRQNLIQLILNECEKNSTPTLNDDECSSSSSFAINSYTTQLNGPSIVKKRKLFHYDKIDFLQKDSIMTPIDEINAYINDPIRSEFSLYWKNSKLNCLKDVIKKVFSVQASSAPIERVFSQAGVIMSPRRTSMSEELFKNLVFLRVNQNFI